MKTLMLASALLLAGCNVYRPVSTSAVVPDENTIGRQCLIESAGPGILFGPIGALASYSSDRMSMDGCMAAHGWVRD
jgi:hypothetical protein